jgi:hypothetical protein
VPYTDAPVWVTAAETFDGTDYVPGTLRGNSLPGAPTPTTDTSGAYGWFVPTAPIQTLQITFGIREGFPTAQLWLVAPAPKVVVTGVVTPPAGQSLPAGTSVQINDAAGAPLLDIEAQPLEAPVDTATGAYSVELPQEAAGYQAQVIPPPGFTAPAPIAIPGVPDDPTDLTAVAPAIAIAAVAVPTDPGAPPPPPPAPQPAARPTLADSGASGSTGRIGILGAGALAAGALVTLPAWLRRRVDTGA